MINVLIVEDELPTARYIARLVEKNPAFCVASMEINGERALQFLRTNRVDLIISDIQMPLMDGLQMLEVVQQEFPACLTVILTGFSYFEYARTALQFHAFDYLLKPIDNHAFGKMLTRAEALCREHQFVQTHVMLESVLSGKAVSETSETFYVILTVSNGSYSCFLPACHVFRGTGDKEQIWIPQDPLWNPEQLQQLRTRLTNGTDLIATANRVPLTDLNGTVERLRSSLEQQARLFQPNLLCIDSGQQLPARRDKPLREMHPEQAVLAICDRDSQALRDCLTRMWQVAERYGFLRRDAETYLSSVLLDSRVSQLMTADCLHRAQSRLLNILQTAGQPEECTEQLADFLLSLPRETNTKRNIDDVVEEIALYLQTNFHKPITTDDLSRRYGFVPQYLNRAFKRQKGVRPAEYLLNLRIRQAKHMLETMPEILVKNVATSVGYSNHHYFSKVFHRATGLWPTEYQQSSQNKRN